MLAVKTQTSSCGAVLVEQGFVPCHLRRLDQGLARITCNIDGRVETLGHLLPGDYFSTESITGGESNCGIEVISDSAAYSVIFTDNLPMADVRLLAVQLGRQSSRMALTHALTRKGELRARVSRYLLGMAHSPLASWRGDGTITISGVTHELMGSAVGCIRVHLTRILKVLEDEGLVVTGYRSINLLDLPGLYESAGAQSSVAAKMLDSLFTNNVGGDSKAAGFIEHVLSSRVEAIKESTRHP